MIRTLALFLLLFVAGCVAPESISPPPVKRSAAKYFPPPITKITLVWGDCAPQPPGTFYRLYDTDDFSYWALYAETTNRFITIPINTDRQFFKVCAVVNGHEECANSECP